MIWIVGMVLVVFFADLGNVLTMREGPVGEVPNKMSQARSDRCEPVVDMRGHCGIDGSGHEAVTLQPPHRDSQHALGDALNGSLQFPEPTRTVGQFDDDEHGPLVTEPVQECRGCRSPGDQIARMAPASRAARLP